MELAKALVRSVLSEPLVRPAVTLDELLRKQNPLALVRAVELAETVLTGAATDTHERRLAEA